MNNYNFDSGSPECATVHTEFVLLWRGERSISVPLRYRRYQCRIDPVSGEPLEASDPELIQMDRADAARIWQETFGEPLPDLPPPRIAQPTPVWLSKKQTALLDRRRGERSREEYIDILLKLAS